MAKLTRRRVLAGLSMAGVGGAALAAGRGVAPTPTAAPVPQFTSLTLDNFVWTTNAAAVTIGNVVALTDIPATLTGATLTVSDTTNFQFTNGGVYPCALQAKAGVAAGAYTGKTMTISLAGIGNTPYTQTPAMTLTGSSGTAVALVRTIHNAGSGTPAVAFWNMGHPFPKSVVPTGSVVTAAFGGVSVPVQGFAGANSSGTLQPAKLESDGSFAWSDLHVDLSGQMPAPGASKDLVLTVASGSWSNTTNRTDADWSALVDTVEITSLATTGTSAGDMDGSGTWTATFDAGATNTIFPYGAGALGLRRKVYAPFINTTALPSISLSSLSWSASIATGTTSSAHGVPSGRIFRGAISGASRAGYNGVFQLTSTGTTTFTYHLADPGGSATGATFQQCHRFLFAVMEYWATQKGDGTAGPVMSIGPLIHNTLVFHTNASKFTYDVAFKRNGSTIRSEVGVPHIACTIVQLQRPDGRGDWSANDPSIFVTQNYTLLADTGKIPNYAPGISYTGPSTCQPTTAATVNTSTGVFTVGSNASLQSGTAHSRVIAVTVSATVMPTGITAGKVYWLKWLSSTTDQLYDTLANALVAGATGKVIPSTTGTAVVLIPAIGPTTSALYTQDMGGAGDRLELSLYGEYGAAAIVANTQAAQDLARVMGMAIFSSPDWAMDDSGTDGITRNPSLLSAGLTPSGWPNKNTSRWGAVFSSDIGTPTTSAPNKNGWNNEEDHFSNCMIPVWLLEGGAINQELLFMQGNRAIAERGTANRNVTINGVAYTGLCGLGLYNYNQPRAGAWNIREMAAAGFAASQGSAEEAYFRDGALTINVAAQSGYQTLKDTQTSNAYSALGYLQLDELTYPPESATQLGPAPFAKFMYDYGAITTQWAAMLHGDFVSGLNAFADYAAKRLVLFYTNANNMAWFATGYRMNFLKTDQNGATPGTYVTTLADIGFSTGENIILSMAADGTLTFTNVVASFWTVKVDDKLRPINYASVNAGSSAAWPSNITDQTEYWVINPSASVPPTFQISATQGGTAITPTGGAKSGMSAYMIPTGQTNPTTGTMLSNGTGQNSDLAVQKMILAMATTRGVSGASAAYGTTTPGDGILSRYTGDNNLLAMWAVVP